MSNVLDRLKTAWADRKLASTIGTLGDGPAGYWLCFALLSLGLFWSFGVDRYFSADGVTYYVGILENGWFMDFAWARNHAVYLSQWPLVLGVRAGITDLDVLELLFAVSLYFPYVLSFLLCVIACRGGDHSLLFLPLASIVIINYASDAVMVGEHHVLALLTWPILFFSLRRPPLRAVDIVLLFVLLLAYLRLYEGAVGTVPVLILIYAIRLHAYRDRQTRVVSLAATGFLLAALAIAAWWIVFPRDPANRSSFLSSVVRVAGNPETLLGLFFLVPFLVGVLERQRAPFRRLLIVYGALVLIIAFLVAPAWAIVSFSTRTSTLVLLPFLLLVAAYLHFRQVRLEGLQFATFFAFVIGSLVVHGAHSRDWIAFRHDFRQILSEREGYVAVEETTIADNVQHWGGTNPLLSAAWSRGTVRAIIRNSQSNPPYRSRNEYFLQRYFSEVPEFVDLSPD